MMTGAWKDANNVLCIRLDSLGDVLMCTPAIRAIKQSRSGRTVTLLGSGSGVAAAPFVPEIDSVSVYAAPWMKSTEPHERDVDLALVRLLQEHNFDAAVIFTSYSQSPLPAALLCYLAGIPLRLAHCRENPYQMLTDWVSDPEPHDVIRHEVRRQLDLVADVGYRATNENLSFAVPAADLAWMGRRLSAIGVQPYQPWILLHPGATAASRRYPARHWSEVVRRLTDEFGYSVVLTGASDEISTIEEIRCAADGLRAHSFAGELDLGKLGAAISLASVVVSNNTGPAHMAAAIGTPLVDLYALTNPQHTPWQVESRVLFHDVPCRFCYKSICPEGHHHCLEMVDPARVVEAVLDLMRLPDLSAGTMSASTRTHLSPSHRPDASA